MKVRHLLAGMRADIGEQPIAGRDQPLSARDLADGADEARNLLGRGTGREIVPRDIGSLGDDEDVDRRLRRDVVKGQRVIVFVDGPGRNLPRRTRAKILPSS